MANKEILIKIPRQHGDTYLKMEVHHRMKIPGLLKRIEAREMVETHPDSNYGGNGEIRDSARYEVFTDNADKTLDLIKNYKKGIKENSKYQKDIQEFNPSYKGIFPPKNAPKEEFEEEYIQPKPGSGNYVSRLLKKLF
jgi:hypothetical protein